MRLLSIDVGSTRSGYVILDTRTLDVVEAGDVDNGKLLERIDGLYAEHALLSSVKSGQPDRVPMVVEWFASHDPSAMAALGTLDRAIKTKDWSLVAKAKGSVSASATTTGNVATSALWLGMFLHAAGHTLETVGKVTRAEVKKLFRVSGTGADSQVRAALIQTYGEGSEKRNGRLAAVKGDAWSSLAVARCYLHREKLDQQADAELDRAPF